MSNICSVHIFYIYIHSKITFRDKGSTSTFLSFFFLFPLPFFQKVCIPTILAVKTEEDTDWLAIKQDRILLQANRDYLAKIVILYIVIVFACGEKKNHPSLSATHSTARLVI